MSRPAWLAALLLPVCAHAESFTLPPAFWLGPRSGAAVLAEPALVKAVNLWLDRPRARILLHHAREDEAQARAEELRGWLIALGVEGPRVELVADGPADRTLRIEVSPE